jgi:hypothetical protein
MFYGARYFEYQVGTRDPGGSEFAASIRPHLLRVHYQWMGGLFIT